MTIKLYLIPLILLYLLYVQSFHISNSLVKTNQIKSRCDGKSIKQLKDFRIFSQEIEPIQIKSDTGFDLGSWFNPNTRGGVIVWSILLITVPIAIYNYYVSTGLESYQVGAYVGASVVLISNLLWASTYIFRVVNKDMTYARQLRDYENAVLQKRLDELGDDEIKALMEEIDREEGNVVTPANSE